MTTAQKIAEVLARVKGGKIQGDVNLSSLDLTALPDLSQVEVTGNFSCNNNRLTSLRGAPQSVGKHFWCNTNLLTSLQGAPQSVGGDFYCGGNRLTSLRGAPQSVGGGFYCSYNSLTSLRGCPQSVGGGFFCRSNLLTSLRGAPQSVGGSFYCADNPVHFTAAEVAQALASEQRSAGGLGEAVEALLKV